MWGYVFRILIIVFEQAYRDSERGCIEDDAILHILRKGLNEFQGTTDGDTERVNAGFQTFQQAAFKDTHQRDLPSKLEVVLLLPGPLVAFEVVVRQVEGFDGVNDVLVEAFISCFQIVFNGVKLTSRPGDLLATHGGIWIGATNELACPPNNDFFEQVEDTDTTFFDRLPASCQKVGVQVPNPSRGEVGAVIAGEEIDLVVQIEDVVVNGRCCQQNELFAPTISATATIRSEDIFELEIALGAFIAEIVSFVNENHIHVSHIPDVEIIDGEALLRDDIRRN